MRQSLQPTTDRPEPRTTAEPPPTTVPLRRLFAACLGVAALGSVIWVLYDPERPDQSIAA